MSINIGDNFSYLGKKFLDSRQSFDTLELMNNCFDVPLGFITYCKEDNKRYEYSNTGWVEYKSSITDEEAEKLNIAYLHSQTTHVQADDLEGFATEDFVKNKIAEAQLSGGEVDLSGYATKEYVDDAISNVDVDLSDYVTNDDLEESLANKFDNVELNEAETNDTQTALDFYANGEVVKTVYFTGGGGGNANTPPYVTLLSAENNILGLGEVFNLELDFLSGVTGKGTLKVFINDIEVISKSIPQGENTIPITDDNFIKGNNRITLYVIDRTGTMSNSVTLYVRYGSLEIVSDFDAYTAYEPGAVVRYYFTPTAVDTSLALTMYMKIDGEVKPGVSCQSDTRGYYTFPSNLNVGAHYCQAYIIDSAGNTSNILVFNLIILDDTSLIVASDTINPSIEEGEQLSLDYKVYMKNNTSFITKIYIDDVLVSTGTCGLDFAYYRTSSLTEGIHTVKLEVYNVTETVSDYIIWTVTITPSTYAMLEPINAGALFIGTAQNMTNSSEGKEIWKGKDQDGNIVNGILNNFAFNSESGWVDDELLITGASSVEIPITPLANNARYGFTLDIEFASKMIGVEDALVLNLWDEEKDCGIKITTEKVILRSAEGNQADLYFTDSEMTSVIFVIDRNELKAKIYLNGVMCRAFHLSDYSIDGVPYLEDFTVNNTIILGGSGHARIKNLRVYQVALTTDEILNNFMANEKNKGKQKELVEFQKGNHLPTLTIYCDFSGLGKDDKKPCSITYVSTDEEKYGKSFTLNHKKSTCQYQGTSSMAYPIKNYRLNLADEKGNKWKYNFPYGKPERRFTLKADFMSSGHWTNTGLTKWINNNLYNYDLNDEKTMNPKKWYDINNGGSIDDTRECIYGFPCRLILVNDGNTPLNEGQNEPTPGNTKDMGIFNFNHDKDATDTMGFDDDVFPNCASYEVTANSDTSAGAFMRYQPPLVPTLYGYKGGSYLIEVPLHEITGGQVKCESDGTHNNLNKFLPSGQYYNPFENTVSFGNDTTMGLFFSGDQPAPTWVKINDMMFAVEMVPPEKAVNPTLYDYKVEDELDYIKQSFELRFPDEDDVPEGWGFMGITKTKKCIDYWLDGPGQSKWTTKMNAAAYFGTNELTVETKTGSNFTAFGYNTSGTAAQAIVSNASSGTTITVTNNILLAIYPLDNSDCLIINGVEFELNNNVGSNNIKDPYEVTYMEEGTGLKALVDWVDGCTDEEFVRDFDQHFNRDYTLRYFLLVITLGMVDNLGKNMMLDTWDNKIFMPRFYDCDTICSYDNSGQLKFDVDIEMTQGYWNTSSSRLWTRIRDLMHDELVAKYNNMRQNGLSYESLMECFYDEQIAKIPQKYYNMDYDVKYAPFADSYIGMANGDTYEHLKRWLQQRLRFVDTLYDYAPSYNNDVLTIRANTTEPMTLEIETYTPVYQHLSWYNNQMDKKKIDGKISVTFTGTAMAETDQEVLIYGGSNIKSIKGITSMNPNRMLIGSATRLIELDAPNCPLLADINANKANLAPHVYLNKVNLSGCPLLGGNLIINQSPLIREIDIRNTAITGLNLPSNLRNLEVLKLPAAIETLTLNDAGQLHTLEFDAGGRIQNVTMTNCNALTNITNFNLEDATSISLNNSYNTANELYFSKATNLSVSNMPNLERLIYTPNAEHEVFDKVNVDNASNYTVSTFNCPKLNTFMTTAPYRESYEKEYGEVKPNEVFEANTIDISNTQFTDVKLLCTTDTNVLKLPQTVKNLIVDSAYDLDTKYLTDGDYDVIHTELYEPYNTDYEGSVFKMVTTAYPDFFGTEMPLTAGKYIDTNGSISDADNWYASVEFHDISHCASIKMNSNTTITRIFFYDSSQKFIIFYDMNKGEVIDIPNNAKYARWLANNFGSKRDITISSKPPMNIVPTASDGSIIQSMYAPSNTVQPASGVWDLKGLELDDYHAFGLNNDVKLVDNTLTMPNRYDEYSLSIKNKTVKNEIARYTASDRNTFPTFNSEFIYTYDVAPLDEEVYEYSIIADSMDNLPTQISFNGKSNLLTVEYLNIDNVTNMNFMFYNCTNLTSLDVGGWGVGNVTNMGYMFDGCNKLTSLDVGGWDVRNVTDMHQMFRNCNNLTSLDLSNWVTSKLTDMASMFQNCTKLTSLDLSNFDTSKATSTDCMFYDCKSLTSLDVSKWDTTEVTYMGHMFRNCNNLTSLDLSNWDTSKVTNMNYTFQNCINLTSITFGSNFNTKNVTTMLNMFNGCNNLTSLDVSNFNTSNVTNMAYMFHGCTKLTSLDLSNFDTSNVNAMTNMFYNCTNLTSLDLSNFDTSEVVGMYFMFNGCNNLTSLDLSSFDTSKVTNMGGMFKGCNSLQELHIESWPLNDITQVGVSSLPVGDDERNEIYTTAYFTVPNGWTLYNALDIARYTTNATGVLPTFNSKFTEYSTSETDNNDGTYTVRISTNSIDNLPTAILFNSKTNLLTVEYLNLSKTITMQEMFVGCSQLTQLDASNWDTSNVTNMSFMFHDCSKLTQLDASNWDTSNVTDMNGMFQNCSQLTQLDASNWDTSNVAGMNCMFQNCSQLTQLDASNWDTSNVTNMAYMFDNCKNLTSLDLSDLDTTNVTNMDYMFNSCSNLTTLDVSNFNTSNVTSMYRMFSYCSNLTSLDLSNFDTSKATNMYGMFYTCSNLTQLDVSNFDTSEVTDMQNMFNSCSKLTSLDVSNFNTSNVTNMRSMFSNCKSLTSLDVSNFDTKNVTTMRYMFDGCNNLTSLDVSNFNTSKVTNMQDMFCNCTSLQELHIEGWLLNSTTQSGVSSLPKSNDAKNMVYASANFTVPSGWTLINATAKTMLMDQNDLANLTDEEIVALINDGWTIG